MKAAERNRYQQLWLENEANAEAMIPIIGNLYRQRGVVTNIYGRPLINRSVSDLLKAHRFARQMEGQELPVKESLQLLQAMSQLDLGAARIDIGKLTFKYLQLSKTKSPLSFLQGELADALDTTEKVSFPHQDVVLYGFGRIGRLVARILIEKAASGHPLELRAIVVRDRNHEADLYKRASLLRRDSIHGSFKGAIAVDEENRAIIANGNYIQVIYADHPDQVDYKKYDIEQAIVVDNTGKWRDEAGLGLHRKCPGVARVLLTAPGKGLVKNIVYGVNHHLVTQEDMEVSAASCTTNAIVPLLKAVDDKFGIAFGHVETVHAYTSDQNLIDNFHKGNRRGRSAPLNMVLTETGAASAVAKVLPELSGKLTGNAIRVPTPDVSMAILNLKLNKGTDKAELNQYLRHVSLYSALKKQIDYVISPEVVSSDFVGSRHACVVDAEATIVAEGTNAVIYIWYDNEFGYSCQVVRLLQHMAGISYPMFPRD